ncbi:MAG: Hsp33 family molecular chaperone HslO [Pseudomonadota bacterium]|nr:Hsp33 family molecular chaperone HslO [Pseudomonadota bacterium]
MHRKAYSPGVCLDWLMDQRFIPDDIVQPFQLENAVARGRLVRLGPVVQEILNAHDYPEPVARILAETLSLASLVAGIFKFDGVFSLQAKGDGPLGIVVVDLTSNGALRGYAQFRAKDIAALGDKWCDGPVPHLLGGGYLSLTVDQGKETERYQGIVELTGETLADCAHNYFRQSDQFEGIVKLTSGRNADGGWRSGGLLIQKMPPAGTVLQSGDVTDEELEEAWRRAVALMASSRDEELLNVELHPHELLFRLFHEDGVRVFDPDQLEMRCRCSKERVENMLKSFPRAEIETLKVGENVLVSCEFCGRDYMFSEKELDQIFGA